MAFATGKEGDLIWLGDIEKRKEGGGFVDLQKKRRGVIEARGKTVGAI